MRKFSVRWWIENQRERYQREIDAVSGDYGLNIRVDRSGDLPSHCFSCGAFLVGGATKHVPGCSILQMIEDVFGPSSARSVTRQ